ncbi:histone-lysine N-methyltransferase SETMAR [Trichonephila clavipes]|nr:histone-lysine N-methyltransferase SETMAR [Trichonephila clavipes]
MGNVHDEPRSNRPSVITDDLVNAVDEKIREDRRFTISTLALAFPNVERIVRGDETWVCHITPESKRQSMEWSHRNSPVRVKAKRTISTRKVMANVFWDRHGVLSLDGNRLTTHHTVQTWLRVDFHLFRYLKEFLGGKRFDTADEVKEEVQTGYPHRRQTSTTRHTEARRTLRLGYHMRPTSQPIPEDRSNPPKYRRNCSLIFAGVFLFI